MQQTYLGITVTFSFCVRHNSGEIGVIVVSDDASSQIRGIGHAVYGARDAHNGLRGRWFADDQRRACLLPDDGEQVRSQRYACVTGLLS